MDTYVKIAACSVVCALLCAVLKPHEGALALGAGVFGAMMQSGGFETMFVGMHRMLFINDNWLLNPATDILIRMMPQNLFETALADVLGQFARALVLSILLLAAAYAVVSGMVKRQLTQTEERP